MANLRPHKGIHPVVADRVWIDPSAVVIGDVHLADDSSVWPMAVLRGDIQRIRLGARCSLQDGSVLHVTHAGPYSPDGWPLIIGDDVTVGHRAVLHGCTLGSRILVGMAAIVMDGALVEDEVMLGAGTLVPPGKKLRSGHLYLGSPCQQVRRLTDRERDFLSYTAAHYVKLKDSYLAG